MEYRVSNMDEMAAFAAEISRALIPSDSVATVIGLSGDLGSGKTTFTKALAKVLGVKEEILSPTFVLAKFYAVRGQKWNTLVHIDAYRILDENELGVLRLDELLADPKKLVVIEWPEQMGKRFPLFASTLKFMFTDETTRTIHTSA